MSPEVVITGIGMVSPAGLNAETTWQGLLAGGRYVRQIEGPTLRGCAFAFAGQAGGFTPPRGTENQDRVCQMAVAAADEAARSAELPPDLSGCRAAVSIGTSKGGLQSFSDAAPLLTRKNRGDADAVRLAPMLASIPPDGPARSVAARFRAGTGMHATVAACSTGTLAVIRGAQFITDGHADLVICGSSDASIHPLWLGAFEQMGVLAPAHPARGPSWACRPFDRTRAGFAVGEGAGMLVMETLDSARRRGVRPLARIAGMATGTDPAGITLVSATGEPLAEVIRLACRRAGGRISRAACVHAHGTATVGNDLAEARAIQQVLGADACEVPIISLKGAIGHLLGGAGAVELAVAARACNERTSPGTSTLIDPDPELGRLILPTGETRLGPGAILKTALGFGGHLAAIILAPI